MNKSKFRKLIFASLFFALFLVTFNVKATMFYSIETRTSQNNKMLDAANSMGSIYRDSYSDLSLKEMAETNYNGLTSAQQSVIKAQANKILGNYSNLTKMEKLEKFYNWIIDNFYYYSTPEVIEDLSDNCNNPYYLIVYEYEMTGKVRAKDNGYAATFIALARTQDIPARIVAGHYNADVRDNYSEWDYNVTESQINHVWVEAYVDGSWKMFDPVGDSYKEYNDTTLEYIDKLNPISDTEIIDSDDNNDQTEDSEDSQKQMRSIEEESALEYENKYFNPSVGDLSKTHVAFKTYAGSQNIKYISNTNERNNLKTFLNIKSNGTTNGKRINSSYSTSDSSTWVSKSDMISQTNGYGRVKKLFWPEKRSVTGNLKLTSFASLENISLINNKIKSVNMTGASSLKTANFQGNNISSFIVKGSKKLYSLKAHNNPLTYAEYNFKDGSKKAIVKATTGGTFSLKYIKQDGVRKHYLTAKPKSGYTFKGWYKGSKRLTKKTTFNVVNNLSFTYTAKFEKKSTPTYIKISISKQKLWYYKKGKLTYTSNVVTGQKYVHDTTPGTYSIRSKSRSVYLIGPDYKSYVNYWMPIYGAVGLHDATWRWSFGGDIYTYNGSHGCVNLPLKTAKYIYNNVPTGTTVKIVS